MARRWLAQRVRSACPSVVDEGWDEEEIERCAKYNRRTIGIIRRGRTHRSIDITTTYRSVVVITWALFSLRCRSSSCCFRCCAASYDWERHNNNDEDDDELRNRSSKSKINTNSDDKFVTWACCSFWAKTVIRFVMLLIHTKSAQETHRIRRQLFYQLSRRRRWAIALQKLQQTTNKQTTPSINDPTTTTRLFWRVQNSLRISISEVMTRQIYASSASFRDDPNRRSETLIGEQQQRQQQRRRQRTAILICSESTLLFWFRKGIK